LHPERRRSILMMSDGTRPTRAGQVEAANDPAPGGSFGRPSAARCLSGECFRCSSARVPKGPQGFLGTSVFPAPGPDPPQQSVSHFSTIDPRWLAWQHRRVLTAAVSRRPRRPVAIAMVAGRTSAKRRGRPSAWTCTPRRCRCAWACCGRPGIVKSRAGTTRSPAPASFTPVERGLPSVSNGADGRTYRAGRSCRPPGGTSDWEHRWSGRGGCLEPPGPVSGVRVRRGPDNYGRTRVKLVTLDAPV
jgi:hypothetical protein